MTIDLRQLRHVLALDQHRSFARAAESVGLTQPALSRSIQVLEKSIGAKLFDRDRTRVVPTPIGERLIAQARPLLVQAGDIDRDLQQILGLEAGLLRIGAGPYPAEISVGTAVGRLVGRYPGIRVDLSVGDWPVLVQRVVTGEIDVAIAETSFAVNDERLHVESLPQHQGVFFCRPGHPLVPQVGPTLEDVRRYPLVITSLPTRLAQLADARTRTCLRTCQRVPQRRKFASSPLVWHAGSSSRATRSASRCPARSTTRLRSDSWRHCN